MKSLFIVGFFIWIAATASSLTDETANKILDTFHVTASHVVTGYEAVKEKSAAGIQELQQELETAQQTAKSPPSNRVLAQLVTQSACLKRAELMTQLRNDYGETVSLVGQNTDGRVVEVMHSDSGTFSIISTDANGTACLLASGETQASIGALAMLTQR